MKTNHERVQEAMEAMLVEAMIRRVARITRRKNRRNQVREWLDARKDRRILVGAYKPTIERKAS